MSLYLTHRPKTFKEVLGNQATVEALEKMVQEPDTCPHAFLFKGPKGCGKTSLARILASELGVTGNDMREMDTADFRGIDHVRDIRQKAHYMGMHGNKRMWILDEAHQLTNAAQSALLKILEDTPGHVFFALCTTDPQKLLPTVKDRCTQFEVQPLSDKDMGTLLMRVCKREKQKPASKKVIKQIIQDSQGHPRAALQILDQVLRVSPEQQLEVARRSAEQENQSIELCRVLLKGAPWKKVANILDGLKDQDPESIRRHVVGYCQSVLLNGDNWRAAMVMEAFLHPFYDTGFPEVVYACYTVIATE